MTARSTDKGMASLEKLQDHSSLWLRVLKILSTATSNSLLAKIPLYLYLPPSLMKRKKPKFLLTRFR
jgi:hypothetical protein